MLVKTRNWFLNGMRHGVNIIYADSTVLDKIYIFKIDELIDIVIHNGKTPSYPFNLSSS